MVMLCIDASHVYYLTDEEIRQRHTHRTATPVNYLSVFSIQLQFVCNSYIRIRK